MILDKSKKKVKIKMYTSPTFLCVHFAFKFSSFVSIIVLDIKKKVRVD